MKGLLLSGGMDSSALAYLSKPDVAIAIDYGQLAANAEIECAERIANSLGIPLEVVRLDARGIGGGTMSGAVADEASPSPEWWPFRNQFIVTVASMRLIRLNVRELMIGAVLSDGEAHRDGKPEFFGMLSALTQYQEGGMAVTAPAITMTTAELIVLSKIPMEYIVGSHSCHTGNVACGQCRGCWKREEVLRELGLVKA